MKIVKTALNYGTLPHKGAGVYSSFQNSPKHRKLMSMLLLTILLSINASAITNIYAIGDSNAAFWESTLRAALGNSYNLVVNGKSGRTLSFDNGDRATKNAEAIIHSLLTSGQNALKAAPDIVLINLGTNDTKVEYAAKQDSVILDMQSLAEKIIAFKFTGGKVPKVVFASPIAADPDIQSEKYTDCYTRLLALMPYFKALCLQYQFGFIDLFNPTLAHIKEYTGDDGIHLTTAGSAAFAQLVVAALNDTISPQSPPRSFVTMNDYRWDAPQGEILGYELYDGDSLIAVTDSTHYTNNTSGYLHIIARDFIGNRSPPAFPGIVAVAPAWQINRGVTFETTEMRFLLSGRRLAAGNAHSGKQRPSMVFVHKRNSFTAISVSHH